LASSLARLSRRILRTRELLAVVVAPVLAVESGIAGRGLVAREAIDAGQTVAVKGGHIVTTQELHGLSDPLPNSEIQIADGLHLVAVAPEEYEAVMLFISHSCEPNVGFGGNTVLVTMRAVAAGEELSTDYAMFDDHTGQMTCRCGAASCRRDDRRPGLAPTGPAAALRRLLLLVPPAQDRRLVGRPVAGRLADHLAELELTWAQDLCVHPEARRPAQVTHDGPVVPGQGGEQLPVHRCSLVLEIGGTWNARSAQRTGSNTESKLMLLTHAFDQLDCIAVEFRTHWLNHQSRHAIERLGAKQAGVLRSHKIMPDGTMRDTVVYILQHEWPAVRNELRRRLTGHSARNRLRR